MSAVSEIISQLDMCIPMLEASIPQIVNRNEYETALQRLSQVGDILQDMKFAAIDKTIPEIGALLKIIVNGGSPALSTPTFQIFVLEILEEFQKVYGQLNNGIEPSGRFAEVKSAGDFMLRYAERLMIRYKLRVEFEPDYEGKYLRAFQVLKELLDSSRFLMVTPDISTDPQVDLNGGLEIEILSQETPKTVHELVSGVLEVKAVQVFSEQKSMVVFHLDPPKVEGSVDQRYQEYLS